MKFEFLVTCHYDTPLNLVACYYDTPLNSEVSNMTCH